MAHHGGKTTTRLGRDSIAKRLGVKLFAGQKAQIGSIIIRQRGSRFVEGINVKRGSDDTLFAIAPGVVSFKAKSVPSFTGALRTVRIVNVMPMTSAKPAVAKKALRQAAVSGAPKQPGKSPRTKGAAKVAD